jgi:hypothetical protein
MIREQQPALSLLAIGLIGVGILSVQDEFEGPAGQPKAKSREIMSIRTMAVPQRMLLPPTFRTANQRHRLGGWAGARQNILCKRG